MISLEKLVKLLKRDIWSRIPPILPTFKSHDTYFENNHGFKEAELLIQPRKFGHLTIFLSRQVKSPFSSQIRTFKTKRSHTMEANQSLFDRKNEKNTEESTFFKLAEDLPKTAKDDLKGQLEKLKGLSQEDQKKVRF